MMHHQVWASSAITQLLVWQCISQTKHTLTVLWLYIKVHDFALTLDCHTKRWSNASAGISKALNPRALSFSLQPCINSIALLMMILPVSGVLKINKILLQPALALVSWKNTGLLGQKNAIACCSLSDGARMNCSFSQHALLISHAQHSQ